MIVVFRAKINNMMDQHLDDSITTKRLVREADSYRHKSDLDEPDKLPRDLSISYWDLIALVLAIVSHCIDVCIDFNVAYQYYKYEKLTYFVLTIIFIAVPSIINTFMSLKMLEQYLSKNQSYLINI